MTVIAAMCSSRTGSTWVASDTLSSSGNLRLLVGHKWIVSGSWAAGVAGHLRTLNVFQQRADEVLKDLRDAYEFTQRARDILSADGYRCSKEEEGPCTLGQMFMLANPRSVWTVDADFAVTLLPVDTFWAEGSGRELAIGAARALQATCEGMSAGDVVRAAVDTAIACDIGCGGSAWMAELCQETRCRGP